MKESIFDQICTDFGLGLHLFALWAIYAAVRVRWWLARAYR